MPKADFAIVGEPTNMEVAIAEKGLMVLDCVAHGISGHAARNEVQEHSGWVQRAGDQRSRLWVDVRIRGKSETLPVLARTTR